MVATPQELERLIGASQVPNTSLYTFGANPYLAGPAQQQQPPEPPAPVKIGTQAQLMLQRQKELGVIKTPEPDLPWYKDVGLALFDNPVGRVAAKALEPLGYAGHAVELGLEGMAKNSEGNPLGQILSKVFDMDKINADTRTAWQKIKGEGGYGFGQLAKSTGNYWGDVAIGFAGDVLADPLTYVTAGASEAAGKAARLGGAAKLALAGAGEDAVIRAGKGAAWLTAAEREIAGMGERGMRFAGMRIPGTGGLADAIGKTTGTIRRAVTSNRPWQFISARGDEGVKLAQAVLASGKTITRAGHSLTPLQAATVIAFDEGKRIASKMVAATAGKEAESLLGKLGEAERVAITHSLENGGAPELRALFDNLLNKAEEAGIDVSRLRNYVPHVWDQDARAFLAGRKVVQNGEVITFDASKESGVTLERMLRGGDVKIGDKVVHLGDGKIATINKALTEAFPNVGVKTWLKEDAADLVSHYISAISDDIGNATGFKRLLESSAGVAAPLEMVSDEVLDKIATRTANKEMGKALRAEAVKRAAARKVEEELARGHAQALQKEMVRLATEEAARLGPFADGITATIKGLDAQGKSLVDGGKSMAEAVAATRRRQENLIRSLEEDVRLLDRKIEAGQVVVASEGDKGAKLRQLVADQQKRVELMSQIDEAQAAAQRLTEYTHKIHFLTSQSMEARARLADPDYIQQLAQAMVPERTVKQLVDDLDAWVVDVERAAVTDSHAEWMAGQIEQRMQSLEQEMERRAAGQDALGSNTRLATKNLISAKDDVRAAEERLAEAAKVVNRLREGRVGASPLPEGAGSLGEVQRGAGRKTAQAVAEIQDAQAGAFRARFSGIGDDPIVESATETNWARVSAQGEANRKKVLEAAGVYEEQRAIQDEAIAEIRRLVEAKERAENAHEATRVAWFGTKQEQDAALATLDVAKKKTADAEAYLRMVADNPDASQSAISEAEAYVWAMFAAQDDLYKELHIAERQMQIDWLRTEMEVPSRELMWITGGKKGDRGYLHDARDIAQQAEDEAVKILNLRAERRARANMTNQPDAFERLARSVGETQAKLLLRQQELADAIAHLPRAEQEYMKRLLVLRQAKRDEFKWQELVDKFAEMEKNRPAEFGAAQRDLESQLRFYRAKSAKQRDIDSIRVPQKFVDVQVPAYDIAHEAEIRQRIAALPIDSAAELKGEAAKAARTPVAIAAAQVTDDMLGRLPQEQRVLFTQLRDEVAAMKSAYDGSAATAQKLQETLREYQLAMEEFAPKVASVQEEMKSVEAMLASEQAAGASEARLNELDDRLYELQQRESAMYENAKWTVDQMAEVRRSLEDFNTYKSVPRDELAAKEKDLASMAEFIGTYDRVVRAGAPEGDATAARVARAVNYKRLNASKLERDRLEALLASDVKEEIKRVLGPSPMRSQFPKDAEGEAAFRAAAEVWNAEHDHLMSAAAERRAAQRADTPAARAARQGGRRQAAFEEFQNFLDEAEGRIGDLQYHLEWYKAKLKARTTADANDMGRSILRNRAASEDRQFLLFKIRETNDLLRFARDEFNQDMQILMGRTMDGNAQLSNRAARDLRAVADRAGNEANDVVSKVKVGGKTEFEKAVGPARLKEMQSAQKDLAEAQAATREAFKKYDEVRGNFPRDTHQRLKAGEFVDVAEERAYNSAKRRLAKVKKAYTEAQAKEAEATALVAKLGREHDAIFADFRLGAKGEAFKASQQEVLDTALEAKQAFELVDAERKALPDANEIAKMPPRQRGVMKRKVAEVESRWRTANAIYEAHLDEHAANRAIARSQSAAVQSEGALMRDPKLDWYKRLIKVQGRSGAEQKQSIAKILEARAQVFERMDDRGLSYLEQKAQQRLERLRSEVNHLQANHRALGGLGAADAEGAARTVTADWRETMFGNADSGAGTLQDRRAALETQAGYYDQVKAPLQEQVREADRGRLALQDAQRADEATAAKLPGLQQELEAIPSIGDRAAARQQNVDELASLQGQRQTTVQRLLSERRHLTEQDRRAAALIETGDQAQAAIAQQRMWHNMVGTEARKRIRFLENKAKEVGAVNAGKSDVYKTFEQLNKLVKAAENDPVFEPAIALHMAYADSIGRMRAMDASEEYFKTLEKLATKSGKAKGGNGWVTEVFKLQAHDGWQQVAEKLLTPEHAMAIQSEVAHAIGNVMKADHGELWKTVDMMTKFFKTYATMSPGFHLRNAMSAVFMNFTDGVGFAAHAEAARAWAQYRREGMKFVDELATKDPELYRAFKATFGSGAGGQFSANELGSDLGTKLLHNKATKLSRALGENVEGPARLAVGIHVARNGGDEFAALARITRLHFDYSQLSKLDEKVKLLVPFWTFMSRNLPLQMHQMFVRPRLYNAWHHLVTNVNQGKDTSGIADYLLARSPLLLGGDNGGMRMLTPDLPMVNLGSELSNFDPRNPMRALSSMNPMFVAPLEAVANERFKFGSPIGDMGNRFEHLALQMLPPYAQAQRMLGVGRYDGMALEKVLNYLGVPYHSVSGAQRAQERAKQAKYGNN